MKILNLIKATPFLASKSGRAELKIAVAQKLINHLNGLQKTEYDRFVLAEMLLGSVYPKNSYTEFGRRWMDDEKFLAYYKMHCSENWHSADRKFFLKSLLVLVTELAGNTCECGVYEGASSLLICEHFANRNKTHFLFDSFDGLSKPTPIDGSYWHAGDLKKGQKIAEEKLRGYSFQTCKGWIPERFKDVADSLFCFVHVDVDLFQPTLDSLAFFYPRMVTGGIIICDDYGFVTCPGAKKAFDDYMKDKSESIVNVPTGQAFIIKH